MQLVQNICICQNVFSISFYAVLKISSMFFHPKKSEPPFFCALFALFRRFVQKF
jgi:hypothetical protein